MAAALIRYERKYALVSIELLYVGIFIYLLKPEFAFNEVIIVIFTNNTSSTCAIVLHTLIGISLKVIASRITIFIAHSEKICGTIAIDEPTNTETHISQCTNS